MRLNQSLTLVVRALLLCLVAGAACGQSCLITVSAVPSTLLPGQVSSLTALVNGTSCPTDKHVRWDFSPTVSGAVTGTASDPDASGTSTNSYTAPQLIVVSSKVTVTVTLIADQTKTATATITLTPLVDVGTGAPTPSLQQAFINAFYRNNFFNQVSLPPLANVKRLGTTGYVQEFNDAAKSGAKLALATVSPSAPASSDGTTTSVVQLYADLYGYYTTVGAGTAGLPLYDTINCPFFDAANSCTYDYFDKSYVLFAYHAPLATGQDFQVSGVYYTEWTKPQFGFSGLGRPVDVVNTITASTTTMAGFQAYSNGAIYNLTSGTYKGQTFSVIQPIYGLYSTDGGPSGTLGLPIAEEIVVKNGDHQQQFEGGILQYTPGSDPTQRLPVNTVLLTGAPLGNTITLNLGQTLNLTAMPTSSAGQSLTDRAVSWVTTNSRVISIAASGNQATVKAAGAGAASLTAASEGVASPKLNFIVIAPCCQVGDGSTPAVQQSFQDALTRNKISVVIPVASPSARVGNGYVQMVQSADPSGATYMLAESDAGGTAYVVGGVLLGAYQAMAGPAGTLGYPVSDASPGGTQRFENGAALAGSPVRLVSAGVLTKWVALGSETGTAGAPTADAAAFSTFGANSGSSQAFSGGVIYAASAGPKSGQAWFVSGLILTRYNALGGANGDFGMPTSDEFVVVGVHQQNFEGGNITYSPGDAAAKEHPSVKTPGIIVSPATVTAGSKARLAIVGFNDNTTLKVSVSGQPDFTIATSNGAFSWDMFFPLTAASGTTAIHVADTKSNSTADGTLTVRGFNTSRVPLSKVQGDSQTGLPGSLLPISMRVALKDSSGNPVSGAPVTFQASSGAQVLTAAVSTDANGLAETLVRLQNAEGVALISVDAPGMASAPVTFQARSAASSLSNFPKLQQAGTTAIGNGKATILQKGAMLTAVAMMLRYHQNRGDLASPNGYADPVTLNQYLTGYCPADSKGNPVCDGYLSNPDSGEQVVNLWRAAQFTGGDDVDVLPAGSAIADYLAQGSPVLISLGLSLNGTLAGGHYVVGMGVASDGSIVIQDPSTVFARSSLSDYLSGFTAAGGTWKADVRGAARFALRSPVATRFLLTALSQPPALIQALSLAAMSAAGTCGQSIDFPDAVDATGQSSSKGALVSRFVACDGAAATYQIKVGTGQAFRALVSDLAAGGSLIDVSGGMVANYKATRPQLNLALAPMDVSFAAAGVVNGATFAPGIAPGGIVSIFGSGLFDAAAQTTADIDGSPLTVLLASPFQINAVVSAGVTPASHVLTVHSAFGAAQQQVAVAAVAPGIFQVGNPPAGAITNGNYVLVGPANPLPRGQTLLIFATGLGTVTQKGALSNTDAAVTVLLNGAELAAQFAGLAPGYPGLYQVNVAIPPSTPPGLGIPLSLKVGGQTSNTVTVAIQ